MDFSRYDSRRYRTVSVREGYGEWAEKYENSVPDELDLRLLERIESVRWNEVAAAVDLACGTGRTAAWLRRKGVAVIDGVDVTAAMLEKSAARKIHRRLPLADIRDTGLPPHSYDLCIEALADEHIEDLAALYREAGRLAKPGGAFVVVGYHPQFLMQGIPTHFDSAGGEPVAIESHVHLFSDHVHAAHASGWSLAEMHEGLVDDAWVARKPKWEKYRDRPVSFAMVWRKGG